MMIGPLTAALVMTAGAGGAAHGQGGRSLAVAVDDAGVAHVGPASDAAPPSAVATGPARPASDSESSDPAGREGRAAAPAAASGPGFGPCHRGEPLSPAEAEALVRRVAEAEDFYPDFVLSVARIESHFRADQVSPKGAVGLMQLMPATAARFAVDICDPADNVRGGVRYLRILHDRYHNPFYMLAAYNAGEDAVAQYRGVPPFPETVRYVADVINDFYTLPPPGISSAASATGTAGKHLGSARADIGSVNGGRATRSRLEPGLRHARGELTMSRNRMLLLGSVAVAALALSTPDAFAQSSGTLSPVQTMLQQLVSTLTGQIATSLAALAVIACGFMAWAGRLTWGYAGSIIFGIVLVFGASQIVSFFQSAVGTG